MPHHQHNPLEFDDVGIGRPPGACEFNPARGAIQFLLFWESLPPMLPKIENYDGPPLPEGELMVPIKRKKEADDGSR